MNRYSCTVYCAAIAAIVIVVSLSISWKYSNEQHDMMTKAGLQECVVRRPDGSVFGSVWQKECCK